MRCGKKGSASAAGARLFALQQRALDRQPAVSSEGLGLRTSLPGWRGQARFAEKLDRHGARPQPSFSPSTSLYLGGAQLLPNRSGQRRPIRHCEEPLRRSNPGATTYAGPATQTVVLRPLIGVGKAFAPPLPPNRTSGFPAYVSPVDGFLIGTVSLSARPRPG